MLVHALRPRVAIMNNGAKKGGSAEAIRTSAFAGARGFLAAPLRGRRRQGHEHAGADDREPRRVGGALHQALRAARRRFHGHQFANEGDQDLQGAEPDRRCSGAESPRDSPADASVSPAAARRRPTGRASRGTSHAEPVARARAGRRRSRRSPATSSSPRGRRPTRTGTSTSSIRTTTGS